ncbi:RING finger protein 112-like isoform X2 [Pelodiscus sinensis]|uniref:RING finger protein 112-like isoform X2 n=1 Tax=Pelodiscus sinensis TaxID=13735 RepID=UPI003F6D631E
MMGNANNKRQPALATWKLVPRRTMQRLREDVTCSICLDALEDPVSIECGHNFCRGCLSAHWSGVSFRGSRCPECWAPCARDRMTPDTRLRSLVENIRDLPHDGELAAPGRAGPEEPGAELELERPVQLVRLDEKGVLILDEGALSRCLEQGGVGDAPVCLVSIIGEQRRGKSFLLNYLLRRLRSPVAVLLVDTEGSMDIKSNKETSVKLSALSMLLGSYLILNVSSQLKDPDLEYLEMFLHVAEEVGKEYGLEPVQHLDLLVRDWTSSQLLGAEGGEQHLRDVREDLAATSPCKHPKALAVLGRSSSRCYLMPCPGKRIATGSAGALRDMDEDFREGLRDYVTALVGSAGRHVRRDQRGEPLTGTQLAARIKKLCALLKKHRSGFSSPCQMAITFHNDRALDRARADHTTILHQKDHDSRNMFKCLKVRPSKMAEELTEQRKQLLRRSRTDMRDPAPDKEALLEGLEQELRSEDETFLETYRKRFKKYVIWAGMGAGAGLGALVLGPVGGGIAAGMAGAAIAAETAVALGVAEAVALGVGTGAAAGICVGGGVGGGVGVGVGVSRSIARRERAAGSAREEGDSSDDASDSNPLI